MKRFVLLFLLLFATFSLHSQYYPLLEGDGHIIFDFSKKVPFSIAYHVIFKSYWLVLPTEFNSRLELGKDLSDLKVAIQYYMIGQSSHKVEEVKLLQPWGVLEYTKANFKPYKDGYGHKHFCIWCGDKFPGYWSLCIDDEMMEDFLDCLNNDSYWTARVAQSERDYFNKR